MKALAEAFDPRTNTLNAVRLLLASGVIIQHSHVLTAGSLEGNWGGALVGDFPVDGFFAVSGYLIARSWIRHPDPRSFLLARVARIYPAFWVVLFVTAFVFAPIAMAADGNPWGDSLLRSDGPIGYVVGNASLVVIEHGVAGSPSEVPWPSEWNGSLWTLKWEFLCYLGVLVGGMAGLLRLRWTAVTMFAVILVAASAVALYGVDLKPVEDATRLSLMFSAGIVVYRYSATIQARARWAAVSGAIVVASAVLLPGQYHLIAALPIAYGLITLGALVTTPRLRLPNDISYGMYIYGFPVTQILMYTPVVSHGPAAVWIVTVVLTVPLATLSWFLVEKPILTHVRERRRARLATTATGPPAIGAGLAAIRVAAARPATAAKCTDQGHG